MDKTDNQKAELIAIYRLEFYKKQKSWKLASKTKDAKHKKYSREDKDHILNKTYDVEKPSAQSGLLNDAFIHTISDDDKSNVQSESAVMKIETKIKTECLSNNHPSHNFSCPQNDQFENSQPWIHPVFKLQTTELQNAFTQEYLNADQDLLDFNSYPGEFYTEYLNDSNDNLIHKSTLDQLLCEDYQMIPGFDCGDNVSNNFCCAENRDQDECLWLPGEADLHWTNERERKESGLSEFSSDSWLDFMRGADMVPHSSKVELSLPNTLSELEVSGDSLARLSSVQLKQAVRAHTKLLRQLLREETHRRRLRSCLSLTGSTIERPQFSPRPRTDLATYEQPTRDFGPYCSYNTSGYGLQPETFKIPEDIFIAGSYRNNIEVLGRGRGRIQSAKYDSGDRFVGVGRGRASRLA